MAVARSVSTRLVEGVLRIYRLNTDLFTYFGGTGTAATPTTAARIYKGPLLGENPSPLFPPQMHVFAGTDPYAPGVANASNVERTVITMILDPYDLRVPSEGAGALWGPDYIEHCAKLIMAGGDGTTANNLGRIIDPDDEDDADTLNTEVLRLSLEPLYAAPKDVAIVHRLVCTFGTRLNQSFTRV